MPVYLLYGSEGYLMMRYRDILLDRLGIPKDDINFTRYTSETYDPVQCVGMARTMPFFSDRRVILIQKAGAFQKKDPILADYLKDPSGTACLIFVEETVKKALGTYKTLKKEGAVFEFVRPSRRELETWVLRQIAASGKKIKRDAFSEFWMRTDGDMTRMSTELSKLLAYCSDHEDIVIEDIRAICAGSNEMSIFDLTDAISMKDTARAVSLSTDLFEKKETPVRIIMMISRQLNQLLAVKEYSSKRLKDSEIATRMHIPLFILRNKLYKMAANFSVDELRHLLELSAELDEQIKTSRIDGRLAVLKLIYSSSAK